MASPGRTFGRVAEAYDRTRPAYGSEVLDRAASLLELGPGATVLDLAAGTGKLTRALVPRFARVIAVDPDDAMRAVLEEVVPGAEVFAGRAEAIPLEADSVDAVFTAEAFHWFAGQQTVAEIARVLRPRGGLAIFWNVDFGEPEPAMGDAVEGALDEAFALGGAPGLPKVLSGAWREPLEASAFGPLREAEVEREIRRDREGWLANMLSVSSIAAQSEAERAALATRLRELVPEAEYRWRVRTIAYWARLDG